MTATAARGNATGAGKNSEEKTVFTEDEKLNGFPYTKLGRILQPGYPHRAPLDLSPRARWETAMLGESRTVDLPCFVCDSCCWALFGSFVSIILHMFRAQNLASWHTKTFYSL
jgi:hypothetical protein